MNYTTCLQTLFLSNLKGIIKSISNMHNHCFIAHPLQPARPFHADVGPGILRTEDDVAHLEDSIAGRDPVGVGEPPGGGGWVAFGRSVAVGLALEAVAPHRRHAVLGRLHPSWAAAYAQPDSNAKRGILPHQARA